MPTVTDKHLGDKHFRDEDFQWIIDRGGSLYERLAFENCRFTSCGLSSPPNPKGRTRLKDIHIRNCESVSCLCDTAILEDVTVDGLKTKHLMTFGTVFKHVVLRGKIGGIMLQPILSPGFHATDEQQRALDRANAEFYANVDWALDIREAEFVECDLRSPMPARLIRRDEETQVVVKRSKLLDGEWRKLNLYHSTVGLELLIERGDPDVVLVAGKRSKNFKKELAELQRLREAGIAEASGAAL